MTFPMYRYQITQKPNYSHSSGFQLDGPGLGGPGSRQPQSVCRGWPVERPVLAFRHGERQSDSPYPGWQGCANPHAATAIHSKYSMPILLIRYPTKPPVFSLTSSQESPPAAWSKWTWSSRSVPPRQPIPRTSNLPPLSCARSPAMWRCGRVRPWSWAVSLKIMMRVQRVACPVSRIFPFSAPSSAITHRQADRKELLVILTPKIIASDQDAESVTQEFRSRMKGLGGRF